MNNEKKKQERKFTMREITSKNPSPEVRAVYDKILVDAYKEQQKILEKAKKLK